MVKQKPRLRQAIKHRQRARIDQGLAKQNLTPKMVQELVCSAIAPEAAREVEKRAREPEHFPKTHPLFWQQDNI